MNFTILPQKKQRTNQKEYLKLEIDTQTKAGAFLDRHLIPLLSFLIPASVTAFFWYLLGFAPFGKGCAFLSDGLSKNLPYLYEMQRMISSGNFSFLHTMSGSYAESLLLFLRCFCSPLRVPALFLDASASVVWLQSLYLVETGLAGYCFFYCLTRRVRGVRFSVNDCSALLFSTAYALSGYLLVQYNDFMYLEIVCLFPLLYHAYERLVYERKTMRFSVLLGISFLLQFELSLILAVILMLHLLLMTAENDRNLLSTLLSYLRGCLLAMLLGSAALLPGLGLLLGTVKATGMPGFSMISGFWSLFFKFLPLGYASFFQTQGIPSSNLYCGLFVLFLLPLYFFRRDVYASQKRRTAVFLFLLLCLVNLSQPLYLLQLGRAADTGFCSFCFVLSFFLLLLCADTLPSFAKFRLFPVLFSLLTPFLLYLLANGQKNIPIRTSAIPTVLFFFVLYAIYAILLTRASIQKTTFFALLLLTGILELSLNSFTQFSDYRRQALSTDEIGALAMAAAPAYTQSPFLLDEEQLSLPFLSYAKDASKDTAAARGLWYEQQNGIAAAYYGASPLFSPVGLDIQCPENTDLLLFRKYENGFFSVRPRRETLDETARQGDIHTISVTMVPDETGDLYLMFDRLVHIGMVEAGKPFSYEFSIQANNYYAKNYAVSAALLRPEAISSMRQTAALLSARETHFSAFGFDADITLAADGMLVCSLPYAKHAYFLVDGQRASALETSDGSTAVRLTGGAHKVSYHAVPRTLPLGVLMSPLAVILCIVQRRRKQTQTAALSQRTDKVCAFISRRRLPILSFLIPFTTLLCSILITSCTPFGNHTWLSNDGYTLTLSMLQQRKTEILHGSLLYSWLCGSGSNIYNTMPTSFLSWWLIFIPDRWMAPVLTILEMARIGLCGVSMYYYLTRKKSGMRIPKEDFRILIFTCAYSLSAYIVCMRSYFHWTNVFILFPLLLIAMDRLMTEKKQVAYTLLLALAIIFDYNVSLFICVFLVFWFFTYSFAGIKDFVEKGLRFALSSILSAGMGFWTLYALIDNLRISPYADRDSALPAFSFYHSYWLTLKQFFLFSDPVLITTDNGAINLYCGTFLLLLFFIALFAKKTRADVIKLCLLVFILFSSNNDLLSYLWNGLHNQVKVPNRYAFLAVFLLIDLAYQSFFRIRKYSRGCLVGALLTLTAFTAVTFFFAREAVEARTVIGSALFLICYAVLLLLIRFQGGKKVLLYRMFVFLAAAELIAHAIVTQASLIAPDLSTYFTEVSARVKSEYLSDRPYAKVSYIGPFASNMGMAYGVGSTSQFNSYLTGYQLAFENYLGGFYSANSVSSVNNHTPFGNCIGGVEYIVLNHHSSNTFADLDTYETLETCEHSFILKNNKVLPIGYYLPASYPSAMSSAFSSEALANVLCDTLGLQAHVFTDIIIASEEEEDADRSVITALSGEEVLGQRPDILSIKVEEMNDGDLTGDFYCHHLTVTPERSGSYYYKADEFFYLGMLEAGKTYEFDINSNLLGGYLTLYHDDVMNELCRAISAHAMEVSEADNTHILGTVTLPEDGVVQFGIPYEPGWHVYVDGKETKAYALNNAFLYIEAPQGTHEITLRFFPKSLPLGAAVTALSWIGFAALCVLTKRRPEGRRVTE